LEAQIIANGGGGAAAGDDGGDAAIVSIINDDGPITINSNISVTGGIPAGGAGSPGTDGVLQLSAAGAISSITQGPASAIHAGKLKVIASEDINLDNNGNNVAVLAAEVNNGSTFTYRDADHLVIGTVAETGTPNLPEKAGVVASGGNGAITIRTEDGTMVVDADVIAAGSGPVQLQTQGQAKDLVIRARIRSGIGNIQLEATGFVAYAANGSAITGAPGEVT